MPEIRFGSIIMIVLFCFNSMAQNSKSEEKEVRAEFPSASKFANSKLSYKIINAQNKTFCYDIFADSRLIIHQTSIPGLSGNEGFKRKESAEDVAKLVISKVKNGEMPPTVTIEEMKKLKAIP